MLIGKACRVGNKVDINAEGFSYIEGVIASDPLIPNESDDFFVLVQIGDRLIRCDTDYIYYLDT